MNFSIICGLSILASELQEVIKSDTAGSDTVRWIGEKNRYHLETSSRGVFEPLSPAMLSLLGGIRIV